MRALWTIRCCALLILISRSGAGETIVVTPADSYEPIESARPGDEVVISPGTYRFRVHLTQSAPPEAPIVIRAIDPTDRPVWDLSDEYVEDAPGSYRAGDRGRGCWQLSGATNVHISGLVIQECHTRSFNSAGMRYYNRSTGIELKDILFRRNDNGLTGGTQNSELTAEFCEFDSNGNLSAPSGAPTHNLYIYGGAFTLRYSYVHDPIQGQNFHIRAMDSKIEYNWFARPRSYAGDLMTDDDLPSGGRQTMLLRGNLIDQGTPLNRSQVFALYNDTRVAGFEFALTMINNTIVVTQAQGAAVHLSNADGTAMTAVMDNNLISGGRPYLIEDASHGSVSGTNNWMPAGTNPGTLSATVFGQAPFADPVAREFRLAPDSTAIGAAGQWVKNLPDKEYFQNETVTSMYRLRETAMDIGAFESTTTGPGIGPYDLGSPKRTGTR